MIFFSRSDLPFFHSSPKSHGIDAFVDQLVVMMLERGKKKKTNGENLKFFWKLETDAGGRKRYGLFSPWIFYLPSVSHPYKNGRQQEILNWRGACAVTYL